MSELSWTNDRFEREMMEQAGHLYDQNYFEPSRHEVNEMPKVSEMFGGGFLRASDLQGKVVAVVIDGCTEEMLRGDHGEEMKYVLAFKGKDKRLVLNVTNGRAIAECLGSEDTDDWNGQTIRLYSAKVSLRGEMVDGIRVYQEVKAEQADGDEIPF